MIITGNQIESLRVCLGLSVPQLANVTGVHVGTVYRWIAAGQSVARVEALQARILAGLSQECAKREKPSQKHFGRELASALAFGGTLLAVGMIAHELFGEWVQSTPAPRRTTTTARRRK